MRKIFYWMCLWLAFAMQAPAEDIITLTDGASFSGEIVKSDELGVLFNAGADVYTNIAWSRFSQDTLKQLAQNPKLSGFVNPFIEPTSSLRPSEQGIAINEVKRPKRPEHPGVIAGLFTSSVGLFILFVLYVANLYAAFEVALVRNRPLFQVMGLSAILPVIGPAIYVWLPMVLDPQAPGDELPGELTAAEGAPVEGAPAPKSGSAPQRQAQSQGQPSGQSGTEPQIEDIQVEPAAEKKEKKLEPQIYARGKFTFNKRFVETKFAGFIGELKGDGKKFTMLVKTSKEQFVVEHIAQTGASEAIFETMRGQIVVPYADIQEIKLNPILS